MKCEDDLIRVSESAPLLRQQWEHVEPRLEVQVVHESECGRLIGEGVLHESHYPTLSDLMIHNQEERFSGAGVEAECEMGFIFRAWKIEVTPGMRDDLVL